MSSPETLCSFTSNSFSGASIAMLRLQQRLDPLGPEANEEGRGPRDHVLTVVNLVGFHSGVSSLGIRACESRERLS